VSASPSGKKSDPPIDRTIENYPGRGGKFLELVKKIVREERDGKQVNREKLLEKYNNKCLDRSDQRDDKALLAAIKRVNDFLDGKDA
jgi:hypothetical protein